MSIATDHSDDVPFGPSGEVVYRRTYSRTKDNGKKETWPETVRRVARGNLALVHGAPRGWSKEVYEEYTRLVHYMDNFAIIPAGRHLWATGVPGRQYLNNCFLSAWGDKFSDHFEFTFMRLFEGGGVGANYSSKYLEKFGVPGREVEVYVTADPNHADFEELRPYLVGQGTVPRHDYLTVADSREGWAGALVKLIDTAMSGTGSACIVFDVSNIRPSGSPLVTSGGVASGPAPLAKMLLEVARVLNTARTSARLTPMHAMEIDHAISEAVVAGGTRRSARMSILHWKDPAIRDFLDCKKNTGKHWTTNISVEVDDEFFDALKNGQIWAKAVHAGVVRGMLENGEPGYWNSSLSQEGEVDEIIGTNPCGEVPLEPWGVCNLGHVNLDAFAPKTKNGRPDYTGLMEAHRLITRFLIRATFADANDPRQRAAMDRNRRIGVGHLGVQGYWAKKGVKYSEIPSLDAQAELEMFYSVVRDTARSYAFELRIPEPVKVTTVAPTGSIAKLPGVSEGIHPIYARHFERRVRFSDRDVNQANQVLEYADQGFKIEQDVYDQSGKTWVVVFPTEDILVQQVRDMGIDESVVESADEISVADMLAVQRLYQEFWADNGVSYTVNIPKGSVTEEELAGLLEHFLPYLKGTTIMVDASRPQAPYTRISKDQYDSAVAKTVEDSTSEECSNGACPIK